MFVGLLVGIGNVCLGQSSDKAGIRLDPHSFDLRASGEVLHCKLPDLRPDRGYQLIVTIRNQTGQPLTFTRINTSCGCAAATADASKPIPDGNNIDVAISLAIESPGEFDRLLTIVREEQGKTTELAAIRVSATVLRPVELNPSSIEMAQDEKERTVRFELTSSIEDVSLTDTKLLFVGSWVSDQVDTQREAGKLVRDVVIRPDDNSQISSQLFVRFSYTDRDGMHVMEVPVQLRRIPKLSVRPDKLSLVVKEGLVDLRLFVSGEFASDAKTKIDLFLREESDVDLKDEDPIQSFSIRSLSSRMLVLNQPVEEQLFPAKAGFVIVRVGDDVVSVPYVFVKE